jgi:hypothetical protein
MIFRPVRTEEVSRVAAPWAFSVVEGEDVDIGRLWDGRGLLGLVGAECFEEAAGERGAFGAPDEAESASFCWVCMRVLTTSSGVVITPAMPPALAAVAISRSRPMLFEPVERFARSRSSS